MSVPVVPVHPVLSGHRADHGRGGRRELHPTLPDARMLRQIDRHENHHASVRHMDRQLHSGHATVHLQNGTRLLCQKGTAIELPIYALCYVVNIDFPLSFRFLHFLYFRNKNLFTIGLRAFHAIYKSPI